MVDSDVIQDTRIGVIEHHSAIIPMTKREKIEVIDRALLDLPQVECPIRNFFSDGLYAREMTIPAGTILTGAEHTTEHISILSKGKLRMLREGAPEDISAPFIVISRPGEKNAAYALEECVWTEFHPNPDNEQSMDVLVERHSTSKNSELLGGVENKQLIANQNLLVETGG